MEGFSYALFLAGYMAVVAAAVGYAGLVVARRQALVTALTPAGPAKVVVPSSPRAGAVRVPTILAWLGVGFLALAIVSRTVAAGRPPYGNMWEYVQALGFGITLTYLIFERRTRQPVAGAFVLPIVVALYTVSELFFPHQIEPLMPALQNNRLLAIHVASMLVAYSILAVSFGAAVLYLVQGEGNRFASLPSAATADDICHKAILAGFPLLGLGIALGAYWGSIAWARAWGWDPKETTALASWLVYAGYLHARALGGWRGRRTAMIAVLGFGVILFNIFVVNFVISGLHSYAGA